MVVVFGGFHGEVLVVASDPMVDGSLFNVG